MGYPYMAYTPYMGYPYMAYTPYMGYPYMRALPIHGPGTIRGLTHTYVPGFRRTSSAYGQCMGSGRIYG